MYISLAEKVDYLKATHEQQPFSQYTVAHKRCSWKIFLVHIPFSPPCILPQVSLICKVTKTIVALDSDIVSLIGKSHMGKSASTVVFNCKK